MRRLLIFLKEPVPGRVKTRLAAEVGAHVACHVYRRCVQRTLERLAAWRDEITLCVEPAEAVGRIQAWLGPSWPVLPQRGATLGDRLADATNSAFAVGAQRVVVLGTDSPWIDDARIQAAFTALERADVALGPAADGGYYLMGLARPVLELFQGIDWSTSRVLEQTLTAARALHLTVSRLPDGYDIDRLTDLQRWIREDSRHGVVVPLHPKRGRPSRARRRTHA